MYSIGDKLKYKYKVFKVCFIHTSAFKKKKKYILNDWIKTKSINPMMGMRNSMQTALAGLLMS